MNLYCLRNDLFMTAGGAGLGVMPKWKIEEEPNYSIESYTLSFVNSKEDAGNESALGNTLQNI